MYREFSKLRKPKQLQQAELLWAKLLRRPTYLINAIVMQRLRPLWREALNYFSFIFFSSSLFFLLFIPYY